MAADVEDHTGVTRVGIAAAFEHPDDRVAGHLDRRRRPRARERRRLRRRLTGPRTGPIERVDIAARGTGHPVARRHEHPRRDLAGPAWRVATRSPICPKAVGRSSWKSRGLAERIKNARTRGGYVSAHQGLRLRGSSRWSKTVQADNIDPQQRMTLELTWEAFEHARIPASSPARASPSECTSAPR